MSSPSEIEFNPSDAVKYSVAGSKRFRSLTETPPGVPPFVPAVGMGNPHVQCIWGLLSPKKPRISSTIQRKLRFADGDFAVIHDDKPDSWTRGDHVALLMHGLSGCYQSGYMMRVTAKLLQQNVRVFRMDHRGCGAGKLLARNVYHAGRTRDVESAVRMLERLCPGSPVSVAGFSLSGNLLLRYLGGDPDRLPLSLYRAVAVCPPIDLKRCLEKLHSTRMGQRYDMYFARALVNHVLGTPQWRDDLPLAKAERPPRRLIDFDELYTAPAAGFDSAEHYYEHSSAKPFISDIKVHTSVLVAEDDPMICANSWNDISIPPNVTLCMTQQGGHLGFIGRKGVDPDNRWMDWRVVDWLLH